jgi:diguanylate cyclase (GGDEF)-like protein
MYYSLIGILALLTLVITNHDVILKAKTSVTLTQKSYRFFLLSVITYYVTDIMWGIFEALSMTELLFIDTEVYFMAMALGTFLWTRYVTAFLNRTNDFRRFLLYAGTAFWIALNVLTIVNLFYPILFWFDSDGIYHPGLARYIILILQIVLLGLTSCYALRVFSNSAGLVRCSHLIVGLSGLIMLFFIGIQIFYPYLPLYAIGYMMSCCLLRTMVVENEREEYRKELEIALRREQQHVQDLNKARKLAYTDALTGANSTLAFAEKIKEIDKSISDGSQGSLAVAVFDVNGLKQINDTMGHVKGDEYIVDAFKTISDIFVHTPVYRVGGDEFVSIIDGADYDNRTALIKLFNSQIEKNIESDSVVISVGITDYIPDSDNSFKRIFQRADHLMYERKKELKNL